MKIDQKYVHKTMITREEAKELLPIIQAFAEGKQIQDKIEGLTGWVDTNVINLEYKGQRIKHRIKPESKYRPFKNQEECWQEMLNHQPFGWIKQKENEGKIVHIGYIFEVTNQVLITLSSDVGNVTTSSYLFRAYTFADGSSFGIKEE